MIPKCSNCYWCHEKKDSPHIGCYAGGKWRTWVPRSRVDIPRECLDWKEVPEMPF